jgi:hypothetical protein
MLLQKSRLQVQRTEESKDDAEAQGKGEDKRNSEAAAFR